MKEDDTDSRNSGGSQSPKAPSEALAAPGSPVSVQRERPLRNLDVVDLTVAYSDALHVTGRADQASDVQKAVRRHLEKLPEPEWLALPCPHRYALDLAQRLAAGRLIATIDWGYQRSLAFKIIGYRYAGVWDIIQVVQEEVAKVSPGTWSTVKNREGYIYRILFNTTMDWMKEERKQQEIARLLKCDPRTNSVGNEVSAMVIAESEVNRLLKYLKQPRVRQAFILCKCYGYSVKEAAVLMDNIDAKTVKKYLAEAARTFATVGVNKTLDKKRVLLGLARLFKRKEDKS